MRRISPSNQQPILPLNMSHYSDAAPPVDITQASKAHCQSTVASMTGERHDTLVGFTRQESYLRKSLQSLLDAQSEGLLYGLGISKGEDEASSAGGDTPTFGSLGGVSQRTKGAIPLRQSTSKISLRGARRGISRAMGDLAALKSREGEVMEAQLAETEQDLRVIQGLISKKSGLEQQVRNIENEAASRQVEEFRREGKTLDAEIKAMESQLWEMKARQRHLLGQLESLENSVQSKLSSYKAALTLAEKEANAFLTRPKVHSSMFQGGSESLWALPVQRRTLEMANEHFQEERERLMQGSSDIKIEESALEEGAVIWEDVVTEVTAVEKTLREEMQRLPVHQTSERVKKNNAADGVQTILKRMENAKSHIESRLTIAEERKWKLLVCCIGAELEAIIEGHEVLLNALGTSQVSETVEKDDGDGDGLYGKNQPIDALKPSPQDLPKHRDRPAEPLKFLDRSEDEDDEPGPELLISNMEDD